MRRFKLANAVVILALAVSGCASNSLLGEPTPLVLKAKGRSDGQYGHDDGEARRLAGVKGVWRRGRVLTVDTELGVQYRFIDAGVCEGYDTCRRWTFGGSVETMSRTARPTPMKQWLVSLAHGEGGYWLAIDAANSTSTFLPAEPIISPDKRYWATGECDEAAGFFLSLWETDEFGRPVLAATSDDEICCEIVGWDGEALKVKSCDLQPDKVFEDRLVRQADGRWTGDRIRLAPPKAAS